MLKNTMADVLHYKVHIKLHAIILMLTYKQEKYDKQWHNKSAPVTYAKDLYGPPQMIWPPTLIICWFISIDVNTVTWHDKLF